MIKDNDLPLVDWELATKIVGKKEIAQDLFSMLQKSLPEDLNAINAAYQASNLLELKRSVHKLHGAVSYCGVPRIKLLLANLETNLKNSIMDKLSFQISQLNSEVNLLLSYCPANHSNK